MENYLIQLFDGSNYYWALAIYMINLLIIQPVCPTKLEGDSVFVKGYNYIMVILKLMAGNFLKAKNIDDVISKKK